MGGRQSYLYIYLKNKQEVFKGEGYTVKRSVESVPGCRNFEVVNRKIEYDSGDGSNFDIYIYDTENMDSNASYLFAYCSPGVPSHVANEVKAYYSILAPNFPLVISFVRGQNNTHHCEVKKLIYDRWNWAAYITEYSPGKDLATHLQEAFTNRFWNITTEYVLGGKETKDVLVFPRGINKKNYRIVFIPRSEHSVLSSNCLFNFDTTLKAGSKLHEVQAGCQQPSGNGKNQIDHYFLNFVNTNRFFHGIIVYYHRDQDKDEVDLKEKHNDNTAIIVEFVYLCTTKTLVRKTSIGSWWAEEKFTYTDHRDLESKVDKIYQGLKDTNINTVILEKTSKYLGVSDCSGQDNQVYVNYTHKFTKANKTVLLFERATPTKGPLKDLDTQAKHVNVYYLKAKDAKNNGKDPKPFLIALYEDDGVKPTKVYHFNNKDKLDEWVEFKDEKGEGLDKKLARKLNEIDTSGSCTSELRWLRSLVCHILTHETPPPEQKPKPPDPEVRPAVTELETPPIPPNLLLIIGCSVGGVALLVLSIVGYGIYWYNTTIKLLT